MITKFERRSVAWVLTALMCLSLALSGGTVVYAEDDGAIQASEGEETEEGKDAEETADSPEKKPAQDGGQVTADPENPEPTEESKGNQEVQAIQEPAAVEKKEKAAETSGEYEYEVLESGTVAVTKYNGAGGEVEIPDTIEGKTVSRIGKSAFAHTEVTKVSIPASVTELQYYAFLSCYDLEQVILPADSRLEVIDGYAFHSTGIMEIELPSIKKIGDYAFGSCSQLEKVTLGNQLGSIGAGAFYHTGLHKIDIPDSVTSIEEGAFCYCKNLTEVNVGNQLAYIAKDAFTACDLTSFTIGNQVKKIGESAFASNSRLSEINIPESVTEIEYAAFRGCTALGKVSIPQSLEKIGGLALSYTAWYDSQAEGIVYAGNVLYDYKGDMPEGTVIEAKSGTLGVAGYAFDGDKNLKEIKIPETVTNIGDFAFHDCVSMNSVEIPESVTEIGEMALGYKTKEDAQSGRNARMAGDNSVPIEGFTIRGKWGSAAEAYAKENGFMFAGSKTEAPAPEGLRIVPEVTDNTYVIGSSDGVTITCTGELKDFVNVMMDGVVVDKSNYTLKEGSTILTFTTKYLDTLSVGKHRVTLNYTYGSVSTELTVLERGSSQGTNGTNGSTTGNNPTNRTNGSGSSVSPRTGDYTPVMAWVLAAVIAAGIGGVVIVKRRSA